jgi:hypothetical protein
MCPHRLVGVPVHARDARRIDGVLCGGCGGRLVQSSENFSDTASILSRISSKLAGLNS